MPALAGAPIFRSFRTTNTLLLRDGESAEFTAATDRITGDTIRVTVSLAVMKVGRTDEHLPVSEARSFRASTRVLTDRW